MKKILLIGLVTLAACGPKPPDDVTPLNKEAPASPKTSDYMPSTGRFTIARIQDVRDNAAYTGFRSVYVITDSQTGAEFVGISGIGISELGSHRSGKTTVTDER